MPDTDPGGPLIALLNTSQSLLGGYSAAILLALLYAFASAMEAAVPRLSDETLAQKAEEDDTLSRKLLQLHRSSRAFTHSIRTLKLVILFLMGWVFIVSGHKTITTIMENPYMTLAAPLLLVLVLLMSFLVLTFCAEYPGRLAARSAEAFARRGYPLYRLLEFLLHPLSVLSLKAVNALLKLRGMDPEDEQILISEAELREILDRSSEGGNIPDDEQVLIENVFAFGDKTAADCMTHRVDLVAVEHDADIATLVKLLVEEKFSRIPVYEEDIDHIIGIFNGRDLLLRIAEGKMEDFSLDQILREPSYTPETAKISSLFRQMQNEHSHMAIVIDEYGGTAGVVTMEDLLEEIVGQIQDEYDEEEPEIQEIGHACWLVDGGTSLEDLKDFCGIEINHEDADTVAGLVLDELDRIPEPNEKAEVSFGGLHFTVEKMEERRIEKVRVCPENIAEEPEKEETC